MGNINFDNIIAETGLPKQSIKRAFEQATQEAIKDLYNTDYVDVDLNNRLAHAHITLTLKEVNLLDEDDVFIGDSRYITLNLSTQPQEVKAQIKQYFNVILAEAILHNKAKYWLKQTHTIKEGIIGDKYDDYIEVHLPDGQIAIFEKSQWVPKEYDYYSYKKPLLFYVLKIFSDPLTIYLSRYSINFPTLLLKRHLPQYKFKCKQRYIGHKSFIATNAPHNKALIDARDKVSQELHGEIIEIISNQS